MPVELATGQRDDVGSGSGGQDQQGCFLAAVEQHFGIAAGQRLRPQEVEEGGKFFPHPRVDGSDLRVDPGLALVQRGQRRQGLLVIGPQHVIAAACQFLPFVHQRLPFAGQRRQFRSLPRCSPLGSALHHGHVGGTFHGFLHHHDGFLEGGLALGGSGILGFARRAQGLQQLLEVEAVLAAEIGQAAAAARVKPDGVAATAQEVGSGAGFGQGIVRPVAVAQQEGRIAAADRADVGVVRAQRQFGQRDHRRPQLARFLDPPLLGQDRGEVAHRIDGDRVVEAQHPHPAVEDVARDGLGFVQPPLIQQRCAKVLAEDQRFGIVGADGCHRCIVGLTIVPFGLFVTILVGEGAAEIVHGDERLDVLLAQAENHLHQHVAQQGLGFGPAVLHGDIGAQSPGGFQRADKVRPAIARVIGDGFLQQRLGIGIATGVLELVRPFQLYCDIVAGRTRGQAAVGSQRIDIILFALAQVSGSVFQAVLVIDRACDRMACIESFLRSEPVFRDRFGQCRTRAGLVLGSLRVKRAGPAQQCGKCRETMNESHPKAPL